jgi:glycosyltransferase involved in cell wall biosynthesis
MPKSIGVVYSPMGIDERRIKSIEFVHSFMNELEILKTTELQGLRVGYVGKFSPNGYSKGVEDLLHFARVNHESKLEFFVSISGGTARELNELNEAANKLQIDRSKLEIRGHRPHHLALEDMAHLHVIVLPIPKSNNYVGFPLKSLEAVASGRIVVAARSPIYESIFNDEYQPYWYVPGDPYSLLEAIFEATNDPNLEKKLLKGLEFTSTFTWDIRTRGIVEELDLKPSL